MLFRSERLEMGEAALAEIDAALQADPDNVKYRGLRLRLKLFQRDAKAAQSLIESALALEQAGVFGIVLELVPDEVAAKIAKLVSRDPARAVTLYETFLAACYAKIEELDDSSGSFGQFVDDLYCGWVKARDRKSTRLNSSHMSESRMPSSA